MDEVYLGGKEKGASGRSLGKKALVAVATEEDRDGIGRNRLQLVPDKSAARLRAGRFQAASP